MAADKKCKEELNALLERSQFEMGQLHIKAAAGSKANANFRQFDFISKRYEE